MNIPTNLKYTKSHEWVDFKNETTALVGITDHAQNAMGSLVFINLPEIGDTVTADEVFGDAESIKAVSDIISPVTGTVAAVNEDLADEPEKINENAYESWLIEIREITETASLMTADEYESYLAEGGE